MSYQSVNVVCGALQPRFHFHFFLACTEQVKPTHFEFSMHIWMCFFAVPSKFQDFSFLSQTCCGKLLVISDHLTQNISMKRFHYFSTICI